MTMPEDGRCLRGSRRAEAAMRRQYGGNTAKARGNVRVRMAKASKAVDRVPVRHRPIPVYFMRFVLIFLKGFSMKMTNQKQGIPMIRFRFTGNGQVIRLCSPF